ncbi:selenoprotein Pb-like [Hyperolius riggenbachi]|uniref:selenoprotein Pb-like n=1 Tax=Hyperolius riggenbachi TaxID=752182 RepID=UPI0035A3C72D
MMKGASLFVITLLCLSAAVYSAENETMICKPAPRWSIGEEVPMLKSHGTVTVVALLQASCHFCLVQASSMGPLRKKLASQGLTNISYIIVNDQSPLSKYLYPELKRRAPEGVPVYQQIPDQEDVWGILGGNKDDFLIYDRCGRLTFHIRLPLSFLFYPYVEAAINATYYEDYCQNCSFYANVTWTATNGGSANASEVKTGKTAESEATHKEDGKVDGHQQHDHKSEGHGKDGNRHHHPTNNDEDNRNKEHHANKGDDKPHYPTSKDAS